MPDLLHPFSAFFVHIKSAVKHCYEPFTTPDANTPSLKNPLPQHQAAMG